ncbi:GGDEF domain-containing phosphodiesterase [Sulfurospirillum arcachonense]|uniref:GGDEF domain-containing phosphodiesterase n=1 Tax=Sulfurospirillum arcachonense TaxID=57666 RepID=UPI0004695F01|nr:GGDEF domain-containing phosphodiesterase [Sulfurospirillum arcachonense]
MEENKSISKSIYLPIFVIILITMISATVFIEYEWERFEEKMLLRAPLVLKNAQKTSNIDKFIENEMIQKSVVFKNMATTRLLSIGIISSVIGVIMFVLLLLASQKYSFAIRKYKKEIAQRRKNLIDKNKELERLLYTDILTGLPNRTSFEKDIKNAIHPKVILVDIDAFGAINEYYGRTTGDFVLKIIANRIKSFADSEDMVTYRLESDVFALLDVSIKLDIEKYERIAEEMVRVLKSKMIELPDDYEAMIIDATIGFCLESDDTLAKALIALGHAKKLQKDFACYLHGMDTRSQYIDKLKYTKLLKAALENNKVMPYFQPILNREETIIKYEALSRVEDSDGNIISPGFFMGTSKKVRLYSLMTKKIINQSFSEISKTSLSISVNLLARDMMDSDISNYIIDKIKEYKIAKQVIFEILEDENIENLERVENFIIKAKRLGVRIAIDDFGTGYSNFSYLLKLRPDYLKIDGSIIKNIDKDPNSEAIVKAIISFAKALEILTIAEFVHSKEVYDKCYELGIDEFQGFYLGKPNPHFV